MKTLRTRNRQEARRQMTLAVVLSIHAAIVGESQLRVGKTQGSAAWPDGPPAFIPSGLGTTLPLRASGAPPCAAAGRARRQKVLKAAGQATPAQIRSLEDYEALRKSLRPVPDNAPALPAEPLHSAAYIIKPACRITSRDGWTLTTHAPGMLMTRSLHALAGVNGKEEPQTLWEYIRDSKRVPVMTVRDGEYERHMWSRWTTAEDQARWLAAAAAVEMLRVTETWTGNEGQRLVRDAAEVRYAKVRHAEAKHARAVKRAAKTGRVVAAA